MGGTLRKSMAWLHTWAGVTIGGVLFVIFWMGSLSVFDSEIDRWMMPSTRLAAPQTQLSLDRDIRPLAERLAPPGVQYTINPPDERAPFYQIGYSAGPGQFVRRAVDPASGALLPEAGTHGGTGFIFPFHYKLHISWMDVGYWLVGLAGMAMLVLLTSGVIIHRKLFQDFFLFRPRKQLPRASLDLHNLTGVLALPFHFVVALSGLFIFWTIYFPWPSALPFGGDNGAMRTEAYGTLTRPKAKEAAPLASLDAIVKDAETRWSAAHGRQIAADSIRVANPGDAAAVITVRSLFPPDGISMDRGVAAYDGVSGRLLREHAAGPVRQVHAFMAGLHFIQFRHWTLRWLYFLGGMAGCVMIATGFLFWLESRRARHLKQGLAGVAVVQGLTVGVLTGTILSTCAFFLANRLLPVGYGWAGATRETLEMWAYFGVWAGCFAHAWLRPRWAWREQCIGIAVLALAALLANLVTTGGGIAAPGLAVLGMDLMLLAGAGVALLVARRLGRAKPVPVAPAVRTASLSTVGGGHE